MKTPARVHIPMITSAATLVATLTLLAGCSSRAEAPRGVETRGNPPAISGSGGGGADASAMHQLPDFTALVDRYGGAVVNVRVVGTAEDPGGDPQSMRDFFRRFGMQPPGDAQRGQAPLMRGTGSGFIVSPDGYILTNAHVVEHADDVTVKLKDRREFTAKVVGSDLRTDVAVLKIDARDLPVVSIGDDQSLKTGEWVLAIGAPFGLENTATAGIVSGTSRAVGGESSVPFIQTDVAVNPGNSGGPLFDLDGRVVGINSMIFSQTGGYMGISFAVPIDVAMEVRDQLVKTGHVTRGRIGVAVQDVDASLASSFNLDRPRGALVSSVEKNGPADKAGVKPGDVILEAQGVKIEQSTDLSNAIAKTRPDTDTRLSVWRGGKQQDITVHVARLDEPENRNAENKSGSNDPEGAKLGLVVRPLTSAEKQSVDTEGTVVVADVNGSAERAGIEPGDIILAVNDQSVRSVQDLRAAASKLHPGDSAALLVERSGAQIFVPVRAG